MVMFLKDLAFATNDFGAGAVVGSILALGFIALFILALLAVAIYVYTSLAWMKIAKKMRYKYPWLAWIPVANISMVLQLGEFHWAWVFLVLIPVLGWASLLVIGTISMWRILEHFSYPGVLSLIFVASMIPHISGVVGIVVLILLGFLAWGRRGDKSPATVFSRKRARRGEKNFSRARSKPRRSSRRKRR